ncbi:hypothetical protein BJ878DRAFT_512967 [Calycina marina]|uniref:Uncharacterized protein n=1 Tax=Calycina marina TaxID=1763456 RepID=A0A9P8CDE0_9HELO|nr:hypothetical protein BJ878DRAFT_512967 [Calycina marina]
MSTQEIKIGLWVDRDHSSVLGTTLTLSVFHANILTSFLSFLITTIIADSLFVAVVVCLYLTRPLSSSRLDLVDQVYVSMRNSRSPLLPPLEFLKALFEPRNKRRPRTLATLVFIPSVILFILKIGGFIIPPLIISSSQDAIGLLKSARCGFTVSDAATELLETIASRSYATERYATSESDFSLERIFPVDTLPFEIDRNATCPFDEKLCLLDNKSAIAFDTGLLDSHIHLGINAPVDERVQYRWRSTCMPLNVTGKVRVLSNTTYRDIYISSDEPILEVDLGPRVAFGLNYTFFYKRNLLDTQGYDVRTVSSIGGLGDDYPLQWRPRKELSRSDGDTTLVFIGTNSILYDEPVEDPVFQATNRLESGEYASDFVFRIIGCVDQHQYCNPVNKSCTALNSTLGDTYTPFTYSGISAQFATRWRLNEYTRNHYMDEGVRSLGKNALIANSIVPEHTYSSPGLQKDQWQRETQRWFETGLAKFQYKAMQFPNVPAPKTYEPEFAMDNKLAYNASMLKEINGYLVSQCGQQRVRLGSRGQNISVLGLFILSGVAFLSLASKILLCWWADRKPPSDEKKERWQQDHIWQLREAARHVPESTRFLGQGNYAQ